MEESKTISQNSVLMDKGIFDDIRIAFGVVGCILQIIY